MIIYNKLAGVFLKSITGLQIPIILFIGRHPSPLPHFSTELYSVSSFSWKKIKILVSALGFNLYRIVLKKRIRNVESYDILKNWKTTCLFMYWYPPEAGLSKLLFSHLISHRNFANVNNSRGHYNFIFQLFT